MTQEESNSPLQNFQNLLPENMIPTGNEQASQGPGPMGNLQFATSNINTVIRDNLSPDMVPFIPDISNNIPVGLGNIVSDQLPPNFSLMGNIPNNLGTNFSPMELQRPEQQIPRLLPGLQPVPHRQISDLTQMIGNEMDKQFQNIPQPLIFFNSPFTPISQKEDFGMGTFEQRFTEQMPYFPIRKKIENSPSTYNEDDILKKTQRVTYESLPKKRYPTRPLPTSYTTTTHRVPYESLSEKRYPTRPTPTSYTTTTTTTSTTEKMTTNSMTTTTVLPITSTTEKKTTTKSYPYYNRKVQERKSKNVYPTSRLRFSEIRYPGNNREYTKKNDLFPIPTYRGTNLYPRKPFFEPNPRFLRKPKFGVRNRDHKNCKNKRDRRILGVSSSESYED